MLTAAALVMGVTSCNNDDELGGGSQELVKGTPTAMGLTIRAPRAPQTYADDPNATNAEIELKTVNVLIYAETATPGAYILEQNAALTRADFNAVVNAPDTYVLDNASKIATTTGNKKIFVAMNYPGTLPAVGAPLTNLSGLMHTLTSADQLSSAANGLAMFSASEVDATLVPETTPGTTPAANIVTAGVKRLVAKVTVQEDLARNGGGDIESQGGILTNLQFALGHANKSIYPLQKRVGTAPNIVVQDPNWSSYVAGDFFTIGSYALASADYQAVDAAATAILSLKTVYAPENTAQNYNADGDNLTYVSVRAQYQPQFFVDDAGVSKGANTAAAQSFWTVTKTDGSILYFDVETEADDYITNVDPAGVKSAEYVDGLCYFRAYINKNGTADGNITGSVAAKFDVLRNNYYKAVIKSIKAPGAATDEGSVVESTTLMVDVEVEPWFLISDDYDL